MQGYELVKRIEAQRRANPDNIFIKWWRKEEDFIDFDLVTRFLENLNYKSEIDGFGLIDMNEMWRVVEARCKGKIVREERDGGLTLHWEPSKATGGNPVDLPYTPESLLRILDAETGGDYVD